MPVRTARPSDVQALAALNAVVQHLHHVALPQQFKAPDGSAVEAYLAERLAKPETVALVAEDWGGTAVGYALGEVLDVQESALKWAGRLMHVQHIAVEPSEARKGWGTALMDAIEGEGARRGADEVRLDYWSFNERARRFFTALGYEPYNVRATKVLRPERRFRPTSADPAHSQ
ncbi:GNAT family N-acetyltransferase [Acidimicrobiaceae bacterium USS-CC1]|uniref:GNAT family N-acetyltransferase n=1 Tax=Acidiferrimicrobium australe TaxID=2664430 RepID=A0ABW9QQI6_9ACTN|nr:GNAT family N-acetyltransferase [Acidiferrimicrobium australe]